MGIFILSRAHRQRSRTVTGDTAQNTVTPKARIHTVEIEGIGKVTFPALSKSEIESLRDKAKTASVLVDTDQETVFRALLASREVVISPQFTDEEFRRLFRDRPELIERVAEEILARSWPNQ